MAEPRENPAETHAEDPNEPQELLDAATLLAEAEAAFDVERAEMRDRLMRSLADLENSRKRGEKDRREAAMYGGTKLARDLLPVYDNLNRALTLVDDDMRDRAKGLVDGLACLCNFTNDPLVGGGVQGLAPRKDHQEGIHEGVVDRSLKTVTFPKPDRQVRSGSPNPVLAVEAGLPRTVGSRSGGFQDHRVVCSCESHPNGLVDRERSLARAEFKS